MTSVTTSTKALGAGIGLLLILVYPLVGGAAAYGILRCLNVPGALTYAIWSAYVLLALLPCLILGHALLAVIAGTKRNSSQPCQSDCLEKKDLIDVWKKCLDVQMHFNGIELQIRNYAVTLLVAVIGAAAYALKEHLDAHLSNYSFSMALVILPAGILGWIAFYFMDRHWYHRLLLGSVYHTIKIEKALGPELELGVAIGAESPIPLFGKKVHSTQKIDLFYAAGLTFLIVLTGLVLAGGVRGPTSPGNPQAVSTNAQRKPPNDLPSTIGHQTDSEPKDTPNNAQGTQH